MNIVITSTYKYANYFGKKMTGFCYHSKKCEANFHYLTVNKLIIIFFIDGVNNS